MSTFTSKQAKSQISTEIILVVAFLLVIAVLSLSNPRAIPTYSSSAARGDGMSSNGYSFASDEKYWSANCSHGWKSDSICDAIVLRSQACAAGIDSAYCSAYETYMKQFDSQFELRQYFSAALYGL